MMKIFCDCCGIEIKDYSESAKLSVDCEFDVDKSFSSPTIDLCINCWGSVKNIVRNKFQNVIIQEPSDVLSHKQLKCRNCENNKDSIVCHSCNGPYPIKEDDPKISKEISDCYYAEYADVDIVDNMVVFKVGKWEDVNFQQYFRCEVPLDEIVDVINKKKSLWDYEPDIEIQSYRNERQLIFDAWNEQNRKSVEIINKLLDCVNMNVFGEVVKEAEIHLEKLMSQPSTQPYVLEKK